MICQFYLFSPSRKERKTNKQKKKPELAVVGHAHYRITENKKGETELDRVI